MPKVKRGGRRAGGSSALGGFSAKEVELFDSIRNKSKEHLIVYDNNGNVLSGEGGRELSHTGYSEHDYKGNNAVHNHPQGVSPIPSDTDLDTFQKYDMNSMTVVSPTMTIQIKKDDSYTNVGRGSITSTKHFQGTKIKTFREEVSKGNFTNDKKGLKEYNEAKRQEKLNNIIEACQKNGYKVIVEPVKDKKRR